MKIKALCRIITCASIAVLLFATAACEKGGIDAEDPTTLSLNKALSLKTFQSCAELETEIKSMLIGEMEREVDMLKKACRGFAYANDEPTAEGGSSDEAGSADYTKTNVQEAGVDEADLIKTDGTHVYAIIEDKVKVARVWPFDQFASVATIETRGLPINLYLADKNLIVLSTSMSQGMVEEVYDISDPSNPVFIKTAAYSATLLDSRRVGEMLYLILDNGTVKTPSLDYSLDDGIEYPECDEQGNPQPSSQFLANIERIKERNRKTIEALSLKDLLPNVGDGKEIACSSISRSEASVGKNLLTIVADDFSNSNSQPSSTSIFGNGGTVYASPKALYIASGRMPFNWWFYDEEEFADATVIHRFEITGGDAVYDGSGAVEGHLIENSFAGSRHSSRFSMARFAMSEYEGYLRVATTVTSLSSIEGGSDIAIIFPTTNTDNRITVLAIKDASLSKVGEVSGMGKGETIHAVRFMGDTAYVVTFKKTDPLYVVDLSTPSAPKIAGELKIPGFSTYLHPAGQGQLIGLGFAADDEGAFAWTQGLKLALFDASDPASPFEVGNRELGTRGSYSPAVEEHHAFTYDPSRSMLSLPVEIYEGSEGGSDFGTLTFCGVMLFKVDGTAKFDTIGEIATDCSMEGDSPWGWGYPLPNVLRTIIIGDKTDDGVITLGADGLWLNRIDETMSLVGSIN